MIGIEIGKKIEKEIGIEIETALPETVVTAKRETETMAPEEEMILKKEITPAAQVVQDSPEIENGTPEAEAKALATTTNSTLTPTRKEQPT